MVIPNYSEAHVLDKEGKEIKRFKGGVSHYKNFMDAVHSRKYTDLHADILEGHLSSALCHTGNISYRLGKAGSPEEIRDTIKNNKDLAESFGRMEEHAVEPLRFGWFLGQGPGFVLDDVFIDARNQFPEIFP